MSERTERFLQRLRTQRYVEEITARDDERRRREGVPLERTPDDWDEDDVDERWDEDAEAEAQEEQELLDDEDYYE